MGNRSLPLVPCLLALAAGSVWAQPQANLTDNATVFVTGLNNPRGLKFGPDGNLYVAEGGEGGDMSTIGVCTQVAAPVGPYTGGFTARISKIDSNGVRTTVVDQLPSSQTSPESGSLISGVADVAFVGHKLYAVLAGAGCSHGIENVPNGVIRVNEDGTWTLVANLSRFQMAHPVKNPEPDDFEPDGTWYSMVAVGAQLFAVEPNHGELDRIISANGDIRRVVDISASQGHIVPSALTFGPRHPGSGDEDGEVSAFFVGNLGTFPVLEGSSKLLAIKVNGRLRTVATGLTTVLGLAFDREHSLYALETTTVSGPGPTPGTGAIVRINSDGTTTPVASGLTFPTAMTFGPDGQLYVSNYGFGFPPGMGEIVRVRVGD